MRPRSRDPFLWLSGAGAVVIGAALRLPALGAHLPQIVAPDEPTTVDRAVAALRGDLAIPFWDWPPLGAYLLAAVVRVTPGVSASSGDAQLYLAGRLLSVLASLAVIAATGWLAAEVVDDRAERRAVAAGAMLTMAVAFLAVRLGRIVHPEPLQALLLVAGLGVVVHAVRRDRSGLLLLAGAVLGLGTAAKYLAAVGMLPALWVAAAHGRVTAGRRAARVAGVLATFAGGLLVGTLGTILRLADVREGLSYQFLHQTGGHLGYGGPPWLHLTRSLPGNWGWPLTVLALVGLGYGLLAGRRLRVVAVPAAAVLALAALNEVRFPHYVLVATPLLAVLAFVAAWRSGRRVVRSRGRLGGAVAVALVVATLVPTVLHDVRLLRADASPDTRELLLERVRRLPAGAPVLAEAYSLPGAGHVWGREPGVLDCDCYVIVSSYYEERFREAGEDPEGAAVYEAIRRRGDVLAVIRPFRPLSYRWDLLPPWGLDQVPLTGPVGATGPELTIVDLRR